MTGELVRYSDETVTLRSNTPTAIGTKIGLEVKLPQGILIKSFLLKGTITGCRSLDDNDGSACYQLEMRVGDLAPLNQKILEAYADFLEREKMLKEIKVDLQAFQQAFETFGAKLRQLRETAEEVRSSVRGTLELMRRNREGKTTIH